MNRDEFSAQVRKNLVSLKADQVEAMRNEMRRQAVHPQSMLVTAGLEEVEDQNSILERGMFMQYLNVFADSLAGYDGPALTHKTLYERMSAAWKELDELHHVRAGELEDVSQEAAEEYLENVERAKRNAMRHALTAFGDVAAAVSGDEQLLADMLIRQRKMSFYDLPEKAEKFAAYAALHPERLPQVDDIPRKEREIYFGAMLLLRHMDLEARRDELVPNPLRRKEEATIEGAKQAYTKMVAEKLSGSVQSSERHAFEEAVRREAERILQDTAARFGFETGLLNQIGM